MSDKHAIFRQIPGSLVLISLTTLSLCLGASPATAQNFTMPMRKLEHPDFLRGGGRIQELTLDQQTDRTLARLRRGQITLDQAVASKLYERMENFGIEIRVGTAPAQFRMQGLAPSRDYRFYANGMPFCHFQVKAHAVSDQGPAIIGTYPSVDTYHAPQASEWPALSEAVQVAHEDLGRSGIDNRNTILVDKLACLVVQDRQLMPVWSLALRANGKPYRVIADDLRSYQIERGYFDVDGIGKVYERNPTESQLKEFALTDLVGDGTLNSTYFKTEVFNTSRATAANHQFIFDPSADKQKFAETSAFTHASEMLRWYTALGYTWTEGTKITISVNNPDSDMVNNAQYDPGDSTRSPVISIGAGDGVLLQNLPLDSDVVSHEFGHHIIYRTLTSTNGESLVLHEGIADFFAFAHSGDACLGESICPSNSPANVCYQKGKCLRSASNTFKFGDSDLPPEEHKRSQFISGMLWDMRASSAIPAEDLTKIVLKSLDYLLFNSGYYDFVLSMLIADQNLYGKAHSCKIIDAAKARGLTSVIAGLECTGDLPTLQGSESTSTTTKKTKKAKSGICGVIANERSDQAPITLGALLLLALIAPLATIRRRVLQK